jgi:hypothetical protein
LTDYENEVVWLQRARKGFKNSENMKESDKTTGFEVLRRRSFQSHFMKIQADYPRDVT